ncbi:protein-L-isoaspartate O-methyltransferase family protein [Bradyrhizobium cenepequi]|uniref:protein-L-isoaspartate O-methyltransferase family protein n=1 Tax=Bradyrhizobium cenepequi TaxID=2821403 RepID=UPI001CE321F6|nr:methyltransferase domain-containing protein [Bradyrhizobium cenepequi]MCA6108694.1 methyltransferase domain-containing protein [Bradyrhizobium cenepequi]
MSELAAARRRYAKAITQREQISSPRVLRAFAAVPREQFADDGPWRIRREAGRGYCSTADANPVRLYDDVLVAIDERRSLDTGLPSLWAHFFDVLDIKEKERVVQIGCGLGYYSAILSRIVGAQGTVLAIDCDQALAGRAASNLRRYKNVEVIHGDGRSDVGGPADVIIVHAGFNHPHPLWIESLRRNGRLLIPLTRRGRAGTVIKITRLARCYQAEAVRRIRIFPGQGRGRTALDERVTDWWERAVALAPLRFQGIEQGLPSERKPRRA